MAPFIITGVPGGPTVGQDPPPRLEINDFIKNEKFFSLYVQALQATYSESQDKLLSYFQISGIHGRPYVDWNGSPKHGRGYCMHRSDLFPTWHRPYVALIEQVIHQHATQIADQYTSDRDSWKKAAADLRQPFWDWATNIVPPDEIISMKQVHIITPNGQRTLVDNPFLYYKFNPKVSSFPAPFDSWGKTFRWPTSEDPDAESNVAKLKMRLSAVQEQVRINTWRLFSMTNWAAFSNANTSGGGSSSSLEAIHDGIHTTVGGFGPPGHMSIVPIAAFDPIFYLHHCQVDRLLAMWSAHHNEWVPGNDLQKDLTPFWNSISTYWASTNLKAVDKLNYTYPDLIPPKPRGINIGQTVMNLFAEPTVNVLASTPAKSPGTGIERSATQQTADSPAIHPGFLAALGVKNGGSESQVTESAGSRGISPASFIRHWTARIRCKEYELGGSFSVFLFLGEVPADHTDWHMSPSFVGTFDAFVNTNPEECANCRSHADDDIEGFVHLNTAILNRSSSGSLEPDVVVPYLTNNLNWAVQKADGTVAELPSLEVVVMATPLSMPRGANLPVEGDPHFYYGITHGRTGGSRHA